MIDMKKTALDKKGDEGDSEKNRPDRFEAMMLNKMVSERIIFMSEDVNSESAKKVINQLLLLNSTDKTKPILLFINSPGGEIYSGFAIYDIINYIEAPVVTIGAGLVASMGTMLLVSGADKARFALPHARLMIHQPLGGARGPAADIELQAQEILKLKEVTTEILVNKTGPSHDKVMKDINRNFWMNAQEAKEYGLVDHVVTDRKELDTFLAELFPSSES